MSVDDTLFAPIHPSPVSRWLNTCREISDWIDQNRKPERNLWHINRHRPARTLTLVALMSAFHERQVTKFWEVIYPDRLIPRQFEFDGVIRNASSSMGIPYPSYGEVLSNSSSVARSIEDMNLVLNTYTNFYIFETEQHALDGVISLIRDFP